MKYGAFLRLKSPSEIEEKLYALKEKSFSCCHLVYKPEKYTGEDASVIKMRRRKSELKFPRFSPVSEIATRNGIYIPTLRMPV